MYPTSGSVLNNKCSVAPSLTLGVTRVDLVTPPYDIPEKLMRHRLCHIAYLNFEPPIAPYYPFEFFFEFFRRSPVRTVLRNHVIKILYFTMKSSYLGYLRRKLLFGEI